VHACGTPAYRQRPSARRMPCTRRPADARVDGQPPILRASLDDLSARWRCWRPTRIGRAARATRARPARPPSTTRSSNEAGLVSRKTETKAILANRRSGTASRRTGYTASPMVMPARPAGLSALAETLVMSGIYRQSLAKLQDGIRSRRARRRDSRVRMGTLSGHPLTLTVTALLENAADVNRGRRSRCCFASESGHLRRRELVTAFVVQSSDPLGVSAGCRFHVSVNRRLSSSHKRRHLGRGQRSSNWPVNAASQCPAFVTSAHDEGRRDVRSGEDAGVPGGMLTLVTEVRQCRVGSRVTDRKESVPARRNGAHGVLRWRG
jgi:hypothetical protein